MENNKKKSMEKYSYSVSTVSSFARFMAGFTLKKELRASFTVEASFVMAIVIWAVLSSIQAAYRLRDETAGAMAAQLAAEILRYDEDKNTEEAAILGLRAVGHAFSWEEYDLNVQCKTHLLTRDEVTIDMSGGNFQMSLSQKIFNPEDFLRKLSLAERE